jgi:rod shape determining protein RodA
MKLSRLFEIDFLLLLSVILLSLFGVLFIYSSGITSEGVLVSNEYIKQIIWLVSGLGLCIAIALVDYRRLYDLSGYLYLGILLILLYTRLFGKVVNGAKSWIGIGAFGIQPSEFAKVITILFLARYLDSSKRSVSGLHRFLVSGLIIGIPMAMILLQPDLGTSLVFIPIFLTMIYIAGTPMRYLAFVSIFIGLGSFLTVLPLWQQHILQGRLEFLRVFSDSRTTVVLSFAFFAVAGLGVFGYSRYAKKYFYWISFVSILVSLSLIFSFAGRSVLKDYQIMRLIVFLDPNVDPRGSGWNIIQSITAIGSGGFWGKGYLQGTQSHYRFLPQQSTDFIFSIFSEEWGFLGGLVVFFLYSLVSLRLVLTIKTTSDPFGAYICAGLSSIIVFHFLINVGMTMGVMPITGIPLLFMSYGGSSLLAAMAGIGVAQSVYTRRFEH